jgi:hypothetical protein
MNMRIPEALPLFRKTSTASRGASQIGRAAFLPGDGA